LIHANRIMRAAPITTGEHRIVMTYLPGSFVAGCVITILAVLGLLALRFVWNPAKSSDRTIA